MRIYTLNKIKVFLKKLPRILGERAFLTFLGLLFLSLLFGGSLFYYYDILIQKQKTEVQFKPERFKEEVFNNVLKEWEEREKRLKEAELKEYLNPFQLPVFNTTTSTAATTTEGLPR
ncbi:hypothetical protein KJ636_05205 [Patescibacteria group bacterium]|nr:hypothetical protein [Patescibacteria group bacterium]MBU4481378.1 hypothetical protein [Patescibacteria group bacterium]